MPFGQLVVRATGIASRAGRAQAEGATLTGRDRRVSGGRARADHCSVPLRQRRHAGGHVCLRFLRRMRRGLPRVPHDNIGVLVERAVVSNITEIGDAVHAMTRDSVRYGTIVGVRLRGASALWLCGFVRCIVCFVLGRVEARAAYHRLARHLIDVGGAPLGGRSRGPASSIISTKSTICVSTRGAFVL